jgi:hypothetical protein
MMRINILGLFFLLLPGISQSAEWSLKSSIDQFLGYDTNVRMQKKAEGSFNYKIIPVLTLTHKTDFSEIKADALYGTQIYTDIEGLNQDIQNYGLSGVYKTEQLDWGLALNHSATPTRNNAVQSSGVFDSSSINITQTVSPSLTYRVTEVDSLRLTPTYSVTSFSNTSALGTGTGANIFRDYSNANINLDWQRFWSERYSTSVSLFYSRFESDQNRATTLASSNFDSYGINFGNSYALSQKWNVSGTIGVRKTDSKNVTGGDSSSLGFRIFFQSLANTFKSRATSRTNECWRVFKL